MALTEQELDYLEEFLLSSATSEECMDIVCLDGFLTALAISPAEIDIAAWFPVIWGDAVDPVFESIEQATLVKRLIAQRFEEIAAQFADDPEGFCPTLYECEIDGKPAFSLAEWCSGFMLAVQHQGPLWQRLFDGDYHRLMIPFMLFGTDNDYASFDEGSDEEQIEQLDRWLDTLVPSLTAIYTFWRSDLSDEAGETDDLVESDEAETETVSGDGSKLTVEVGHAEMPDDCPCGSGDLFKRCCGSKARLH